MPIGTAGIRNGAAALAMLVVLSMGVAACASGLGGRASPGEQDEEVVLQVSVRNDIVGGTSATVYIVPDEPGGRDLLGTVAPDTTERFRYRPTGSLPETYRLLAEFTAGEELVSNEFTPAGPVAVGWRLDYNSITVRTVGR